MAKCKYKSKLREDYECLENALSDSREGLCLFHEPRKDKNIETFNTGIKAKMENKDYNFTGYYFPTEIDFSKREFESDARFDEAKFQGEAYFLGAEFQGEASFRRAKFQDEASFERGKFKAEAFFVEARFQDDASFLGAEFEDVADFSKAQLEKIGVFISAHFGIVSLFEGMKFMGVVEFDAAKFQGVVSFRGTMFQDKVTWLGTQFGQFAIWDNTYFRNTQDAASAYSKAKIAFRQQGDHDEAARYYLLEMRARRKQRNPIIKALEFLFVDLTCGYGEEWWRVIPAALALVFGCAFLYYFFFPITSTSPDIQITGIGWGYFKDCLYFSFVTFTTLGYGDLRPMPEVWTRAVASIEAFTGAFMIALFVLCFARKWMR